MSQIFVWKRKTNLFVEYNRKWDKKSMQTLFTNGCILYSKMNRIAFSLSLSVDCTARIPSPMYSLDALENKGLIADNDPCWCVSVNLFAFEPPSDLGNPRAPPEYCTRSRHHCPLGCVSAVIYCPNVTIIAETSAIYNTIDITFENWSPIESNRTQKK